MLTGRTRAGTLIRFFAGAVAVIGCVAVAVSVGGLLQFNTIGHYFRHSLADANVKIPTPGAPETILLIGSDHRAGEPFRQAETDTMLLIRLDSASSTINLLSVPRDLLVNIPDGGTVVKQKINSAYSIGGPNLLIKVLKTEVLKGLQVNHVIDVNFSGFAQLIDSIGCVYTDVDHRYYNDTAQTDYSSIDIDAGYQKLCGTKALQFVRFRHTDNDLVRNARQQDFIRWAKDQYGAANLINNRDRLLKILGNNSVTDPGLHHTDQLIELFDLVAFSAGDAINQVKFPAIFSACGAAQAASALGCYDTATPAGEHRVFTEFVAPTVGVKKTTAAPTVKHQSSHSSHTGLVASAAAGKGQALALGRSGMPVYYPAQIEAGTEFCSSVVANCNDQPNPASEYIGAYPREYVIHDEAGRVHPAYRMTLVRIAVLGEYYGVQGTTWRTPPILDHPTQIETVDGKRLREYFDGHRLTMVAWTNSSGAYWVSNTLTDDIPNGQMVAIAASLRRAS